MEHTNRKNLLPNFNTPFPSQFSGLQNSSTNAFMSTLQSLQMQSLGSTILPVANLASQDISQWTNPTATNQTWIDTAKVAAILPMYASCFSNVKQTDSALTMSSANAFPSHNGNFGTASTLDAQRTIFPTANTFAANVISSSLSSHAGQLQLLNNDLPVKDLSSIPSSSTFAEIDVGMNIPVSTSSQSLLSSFTTTDIHKPAYKANENQGFPFASFPSGLKLQTPAIVPTSSEQTTTHKADNHHHHPADDVIDNFFTGLVDNPTSSDTHLFGLPTTSVAGGLSPVQFTPPDSPTEMLTSDMLFRPVNSTSAPKPAPVVTSSETKQDNEDTAIFKVPLTTQNVITPPQKKEKLYERKFVKSNKIPVYKQKISAYVVKEEEKEDRKMDAFDFDEDDDDALAPKEKETEIITSSEVKSKNVYVPGIGFAIGPAESTAQDLWRHVVPKKRPVGDHRGVPGANFLHSVHAEIAARFLDPEIVTFAESIRRRKNQRIACKFLRTETSSSTECAKNVGDSIHKVSHPPLPKLIIKRRYSDMEEVKPKRKRRRKGQYSDEDDDWVESGRGRRKKVVKKVAEYECYFVENDRARTREVSPDQTVYNKKKRLMMQSQDEKNSSSELSRRTSRRNDYDTPAYRLSKFGSAEGQLPKGTYVVCKSDLIREDCALWRVDNQNLLQKFPPRLDPAKKIIYYKSSSTYSGWCEQISHQYYRVSIKVLKQTRSDTVIKPEIPLADLFPAMSTEFLDSQAVFKSSEVVLPRPVDEGSILRDPIRVALYTYLQALVNHALTLEFLQNMQQKSDSSFLRSLGEIEKMAAEVQAKVEGRVRIPEEFKNLLRKFTLVNVADNDYGTTFCQMCAKRSADKILQLHSKENYDFLSLLPRDDEKEVDDPEMWDLPALDLLLCLTCAKVCEFVHKMTHVKLHLFRRCEDRLELIGTQHPEYAPERIVDIVKKDRNFFQNIISDYVDFLKKIRAEYPPVSVEQ